MKTESDLGQITRKRLLEKFLLKINKVLQQLEVYRNPEEFYALENKLEYQPNLQALKILLEDHVKEAKNLNLDSWQCKRLDFCIAKLEYLYEGNPEEKKQVLHRDHMLPLLGVLDVIKQHLKTTLKNLNQNKKSKSEINPSHYYHCPISGQIMRYPVVLSNGITCEYSNIIDRFLILGNYSCPVTQQPLNPKEIKQLIPSLLLRQIIQSKKQIQKQNKSKPDEAKANFRLKPYLMDPNTKEFMVNAVITSVGTTYDEEGIIVWLKKLRRIKIDNPNDSRNKITDPITMREIQSEVFPTEEEFLLEIRKKLIPNLVIRSLVELYVLNSLNEVGEDFFIRFLANVRTDAPNKMKYILEKISPQKQGADQKHHALSQEFADGIRLLDIFCDYPADIEKEEIEEYGEVFKRLDLETQDKQGRTCLHRACKNLGKNNNLISALLTAVSDPTM